jgi:hypothetical protein
LRNIAGLPFPVPDPVARFVGLLRQIGGYSSRLKLLDYLPCENYHFFRQQAGSDIRNVHLAQVVACQAVQGYVSFERLYKVLVNLSLN